MKNTLTCSRCLAAVALAFLIAATADAQFKQDGLAVQQQQQIVIPAGGTDLFRALMHVKEIQPVRANDLAKIDSDTIVVIIGHPDFGFGNNPIGYARSVLRAGGAVLIASDANMFLHESGGNPVGSI